MLFVTGTTLSVPSLMGAIMAVGVASANSILLVTFAREQRVAGLDARDAAIAAGHTRIRPVLMTAAAMIVGMIPMAIGGAGEEQNAALARAVIGGLLFATPTTLLVVPCLFAWLRDGKVTQEAASSRSKCHDQHQRDRSHAAGEPAAPHGARHGLLLAAGALTLLTVAIGLGAWRQQEAHRRSARRRRASPQLRADGARRRRARRRATSRPVRLPATTTAFAAANIFARASGYIDTRNVDIGDQVKAGELLATIVAPELDHQIAQAEATLGQLEAALQQAEANQRSRAGDVAPRPSAGQRRLAAAAAGHDRRADAQGATRRRSTWRRPTWLPSRRSSRCCSQQKAYQRVVAPFDGVVTQRNIDIGSLVQADAVNGTFMFTVLQSGVIRTQVLRAAGRGARREARHQGRRHGARAAGPQLLRAR